MTQICAILSTHPDAFARLQSLAEDVELSAVIIKPGVDGQFNEDTKALVALAQGLGAAALVWADVQQAAALGADGVHLPWGEDLLAQLKHARSVLADGASIGADAGLSRHDAMELGEAGADYVAFSGASGGKSDLEARAGLVAWWAELFEPPVVAFGVSDVDDAVALSDAGADFVGLELDAMDPSAVKALLAALKSGTEAHPEVAVEGDGA